jgi:monoamine oxidase
LRVAAAAGAGLAFAGPLALAATGAPTATFDDGSDAIPPGLAGDPEHVIIVGAGWAGLTLANALRNAGVDHVVLEGRDRIGGRAHTVDLAGVPVDLGCSWIHAPIGNPMTRFAELAAVPRLNGDIELDLPIMRFFDAYLDREVGLVDKILAAGHGFNFVSIEAAGIAGELGPDASVRAGAQRYLDRWQLRGDARRQAEFFIRTLTEFPAGTDWEELSLQHAAWASRESTYLGIGQGNLPKGGYRRLVAAMAGSGEVRLRHRVQAIDVRRGDVLVRAMASGRERKFRGSHVVVTVPLGVLKRGSIVFEPRLSPDKRRAIARTGFGAVEKVAMVFDEPFWSDLTHTHIAFLSDHAPLELPLWLDMNRTSGVPALVAFCGGGFAQQLHRLSKAEALELVLARLGEILAREVPRPRAFAVTDWQGDRFSRGAYSSLLVGSSNSDLDALAQPVAGRLLFAGEASSRPRHSLADGAMSTGIREAKRLLRRPAVTLSSG